MNSTRIIYLLLLNIAFICLQSCKEEVNADLAPQESKIQTKTEVSKKLDKKPSAENVNADSLITDYLKKENQPKVTSAQTVKSKSEKTAKQISTVKKKVKKKKAIKKRYSKIEFENTEFDFGEITEGDTVVYNFPFVNVGKGPLEVLSTKATCGCTQPSFPFIELAKGETGKIGVRYISVGKKGPQEATITVKTNGLNSPVSLKIFGIVNTKEEKLD